MIGLVKRSGSSLAEFEALVERINSEQVTVYRNLLAHSGFVNRDIAASLRKSIVGDKHSPGILCWLAERIEPPANDRHL